VPDAPTLEQALPPLARAFVVQLAPPDGGVDAAQVFADLGPDAKGRARRLELMFLPREADDEPYALQFFVLMPFSFELEQIPDLARFLAAVNVKLPIGHFGMSEVEGWIYFRNVVPCPPGPLDPAAIIYTARVCAYVVDQVGELVESVADGSRELEEAFTAYDRRAMVDEAAG